MNRRTALNTLTTAGFGLLAAGIQAAEGNDSAKSKSFKGNINHSVCKWCYKDVALEELCERSQDIGLKSIELLTPDEALVLKKYGLTCGVLTGVPGSIEKGLNRAENHDAIVKYFEESIPFAAEHGIPNIICFSGNRDGLDDEAGMEVCAQGLKRIVPLAEKHGVTIIMELLNSRVNHPDYQCDLSSWGVNLAKKVGSERFKLLYDIYHMQIMEGDIIATIKRDHAYFGHYHTGGVPGRNEIDETQELYYPAIMKAIVDTGFKGFVAQEFIPARANKLESLAQGVSICDV